MSRNKPEQGSNCPNCNQPVMVGQIVICFNDAGEFHADCTNPYSLQTTRQQGEPEPVVLLDVPMRHFPLPRPTPLVSPETPSGTKPYVQRLLDTGEAMLFAFAEGVEWTPDQRLAYEEFALVVKEERPSVG